MRTVKMRIVNYNPMVKAITLKIDVQIVIYLDFV